MSHRILRYEKSKDRDNNDEIFIQVEVNDSTGIYTRAEWLTKTEVIDILGDESKHINYASEIAKRAQINRLAEKT